MKVLETEEVEAQIATKNKLLTSLTLTHVMLPLSCAMLSAVILQLALQLPAEILFLA